MKENNNKYSINFLVTYILFIIISIMFIVVIGIVNNICVKKSFSQLDSETKGIISILNHQINVEQGQLRLMADSISLSEDISSENTLNILKSFENMGYITKCGVLLPEDRLLIANGSVIDVKGKISFAEEITKGENISARIDDIVDSKRQVLVFSQPIQKNNNTVAILCGAMMLNDVSKDYKIFTKNSGIQIYIVDSEDGNFIIDTEHKSLGNINQFYKKELLDKNRDVQFLADILACKSGNAILKSRVNNENLHFNYAPVGINKWTAVIAVPNSVVFETVNEVTVLLTSFVIIVIICFILYLIYIGYCEKKDRIKRKIEYDKVKYMYDVEKLLFYAHSNKNKFVTALEYVGKYLTGDKAFFVYIDENGEKKGFQWNSNLLNIIINNLNDEKYHDILIDALVNKGSCIYYNLEFIKKTHPEIFNILQEMNINNFMVCPLTDSVSDKIIGAIIVCNMGRKWEDARLLESVALSFTMAYNNMKNYNIIEKFGNTDKLTGLLNRNCYMTNIYKYEDYICSSLACIYIDANGLHHINNNLGHDAGDKMLRFVSKILRRYFAADNIYRIGGDEFVIFSIDEKIKDINEKLSEMRTVIENEGYNISTGVEFRTDKFDIYEMVKLAEMKMYESKKLYYAQSGRVRKKNKIKQSLEQLLVEKRDVDKLLNVFLSSYNGVYFVNYNTGKTRAMYSLEGFEEILNSKNGDFNKAIREYVSSIVKEEYKACFNKILDFNKLRELVENEVKISFDYEDIEENFVRVKLLKSPNYSYNNTEIIWLFETDSK